jgi:alkylation response protein AidB-like acyl-CoA dehydrogenase
MEDLVAFLRDSGRDIHSSARIELADRNIEAEVVRMLSLRIVWMQESGLVPNQEASMAKLFTTELNQRTARTAIKLLGMAGQGYAPAAGETMSGRWIYSYLRTVANTIEGGSSEIQRNIIATRGLGLPRG